MKDLLILYKRELRNYARRKARPSRAGQKLKVQRRLTRAQVAKVEEMLAEGYSRDSIVEKLHHGACTVNQIKYGKYVAREDFLLQA